MLFAKKCNHFLKTLYKDSKTIPQLHADLVTISHFADGFPQADSKEAEKEEDTASWHWVNSSGWKKDGEVAKLCEFSVTMGHTPQARHYYKVKWADKRQDKQSKQFIIICSLSVCLCFCVQFIGLWPSSKSNWEFQKQKIPSGAVRLLPVCLFFSGLHRQRLCQLSIRHSSRHEQQFKYDFSRWKVQS